VKQAILYN